MDNETEVQRFFHIVTQSIGEIADAVGASYDTVRSWSVGRRSPSPEHLERLADLAEEHGEKLRGLAFELRDAADQKRNGLEK